MEGNERERFCKQCSKTVLNISDLSNAEANQFLREKTDSRLCVKFYLRTDGTIMTDECPKMIRPIRNAARYIFQQTSVALGLSFLMISHLIPANAKVKNASNEQPSVPPGYKYAGKIVIGGQCPTETQNICNIILDLQPADKEENALQNELKIQLGTQRIITSEIVDKLVEYYKRKLIPDRKFLAQMLEINLRLDTTKYGTMEEDLEKLEIAQLDAADYITAKAESLTTKNKFKEAEKLANYCVRISSLGGYIHRFGKDFKYPVNNKRWNVQLSPSSFKTSLLIREETLKRLVNVFTTVAPDTYVNPTSYKLD